MAVKKAKAEKGPAKRGMARGKDKVGDRYACEVCGLSVTVDEDCGCVETHDIICCSEPMKKKLPKK
jgi:hypothetical protein